MKQKIYSIYDRATMEHTAPFFAHTEEAAYRAVRGSFSAASQLVLYPSDYVIVSLGDFDSEKGSIVPEYKVLEEIKALIPVTLREYALDGTFTGGVSDEKKENPPA